MLGMKLISFGLLAREEERLVASGNFATLVVADKVTAALSSRHWPGFALTKPGQKFFKYRGSPQDGASTDDILLAHGPGERRYETSDGRLSICGCFVFLCLVSSAIDSPAGSACIDAEHPIFYLGRPSASLRGVEANKLSEKTSGDK